MRSRNPWPVAIIGFFTLAIAGCAAFVIFCSRHPEDLVAANYYDQEMRYQQQMERMERGQRVVQPGAICYDAQARSIRVSLPSNTGENTPAGTICLYRPSSAAQDRKIELKLDKNGSQRIDASELLPGLWRVQVSWQAGGQEYYLEQKLELRS